MQKMFREIPGIHVGRTAYIFLFNRDIANTGFLVTVVRQISAHKSDLILLVSTPIFNLSTGGAMNPASKTGSTASRSTDLGGVNPPNKQQSLPANLRPKGPKVKAESGVGSGERCSYPKGVRSGAPTANAFWSIPSAENASGARRYRGGGFFPTSQFLRKLHPLPHPVWTLLDRPAFEEGNVEYRAVEVDELKDDHFERVAVFVRRVCAMRLCKKTT